MKKFISMLKGKSKTVNFNALVAGIVATCAALGYDVNPELVVSIQTLGNIFLRSVTTKPIEEK